MGTHLRAGLEAMLLNWDSWKAEGQREGDVQEEVGGNRGGGRRDRRKNRRGRWGDGDAADEEAVGGGAIVDGSLAGKGTGDVSGPEDSETRRGRFGGQSLR